MHLIALFLGLLTLSPTTSTDHNGLSKMWQDLCSKVKNSKIKTLLNVRILGRSKHLCLSVNHDAISVRSNNPKTKFDKHAFLFYCSVLCDKIAFFSLIQASYFNNPLFFDIRFCFFPSIFLINIYICF